METSIAPLLLEALKVVGITLLVFFGVVSIFARIFQDILHDIEDESIFANPLIRDNTKVKIALKKYLSFYSAVTEDFIKSIPRLVGLFSSLVTFWVAYKLLLV